jgi:cell wall-associated NlpC family hydrolase
MANAKAVLEVATSFADKHYKEGPGNDSLFGRWYGINHAPWCAMFVSYCFNKAGVGRLVAASPKGFASCVVGHSWLRAHGRPVEAIHAEPGDVVFFNFSHNRVPEHVGIVVSNDPMHRVLHTVEGNTANPNGKSQVNGDGVYYKTRPYGYAVSVIRPAW